MSYYDRQKFASKDLAIQIPGVSRSFFEKLKLVPDGFTPNSHSKTRSVHLYSRMKLALLKSDPRIIEYHQKKQEKLMLDSLN